MIETRGHCLCGATRWAASGKPRWTGFCHCESCRRHTAAPVSAYIAFVEGNWRWTGAEPGRFESTPGTYRYFCTNCGSPMAYASDRWAEEMHFHAATMDDPGTYDPRNHFHWEEKVEWLHIEDGLRKFARTGDAGPPLP